jgi:hypothetical protein
MRRWLPRSPSVAASRQIATRKYASDLSLPKPLSGNLGSDEFIARLCAPNDSRRDCSSPELLARRRPFEYAQGRQLAKPGFPSSNAASPVNASVSGECLRVSVLWLATVPTLVLFEFGVRKVNFDAALFAGLTAVPVFVGDREFCQFVPFDRNPGERMDGDRAVSQQPVSFRTIHRINPISLSNSPKRGSRTGLK